jgi:ribosomal protein L9
VGASRRKRDKPLITSSQHLYVKGQIPVVLLQTIRGLGRKGQIISVKRGYARHHMVPKGLALLGTWENIDEYADPALIEDPGLKGRVASERGRLPFDWVDEIQLSFIRWARADQLDVLLEPISVWDLLQELSNNHELDLLPSNLEVPEAGISAIGEIEVPVRIAFRDPESASGRYTILVQVASHQSLLEEQRRREMSQALSDSRRFAIHRQFGGSQGGGGFDDAEEVEGDAPELAPGAGIVEG